MGERPSDTAWIEWVDGHGMPPRPFDSPAEQTIGTSGTGVAGAGLRRPLDPVGRRLLRRLPYALDVRSVVDDHPELFQWLSMLDLNVELIIGLSANPSLTSTSVSA